MGRTIIVPVDGSKYSEQALVPAEILARAMGARLVLVYAALSPVFSDKNSTRNKAKVVRDVEIYLSGLANRFNKDGGIKVETYAPSLFSSNGTLLEINRHSADLVVMCSHNHSGSEGWFSASDVEEVVTNSPVPVMLVKPTDSVDPRPFGSISAPLLVPLDGSKTAETAIPHALVLSGLLHKDIVLLRLAEVNPLAMYPPHTNWQVPIDATTMTKMGAMTKRGIQAAADYLISIEDSMRLKNVRVRSVVRLGSLSEAIRGESQAVKAGIIVMATHGSTGLENRIMKSAVLNQIWTGSLPVYLIPPAELVRTSYGIEDTSRPVFSRE